MPWHIKKPRSRNYKSFDELFGSDSICGRARAPFSPVYRPGLRIPAIMIWIEPIQLLTSLKYSQFPPSLHIFFSGLHKIPLLSCFYARLSAVTGISVQQQYPVHFSKPFILPENFFIVSVMRGVSNFCKCHAHKAEWPELRLIDGAVEYFTGFWVREQSGLMIIPHNTGCFDCWIINADDWHQELNEEKDQNVCNNEIQTCRNMINYRTSFKQHKQTGCSTANA